MKCVTVARILMKEIIIKLISKETNLKSKEIENLIEIPPSDNLGDYAIPCFIFSKKLKCSVWSSPEAVDEC